MRLKETRSERVEKLAYMSQQVDWFSPFSLCIFLFFWSPTRDCGAGGLIGVELTKEGEGVDLIQELCAVHCTAGGMNGAEC